MFDSGGAPDTRKLGSFYRNSPKSLFKNLLWILQGCGFAEGLGLLGGARAIYAGGKTPCEHAHRWEFEQAEKFKGNSYHIFIGKARLSVYITAEESRGRAMNCFRIVAGSFTRYFIVTRGERLMMIRVHQLCREIIYVNRFRMENELGA